MSAVRLLSRRDTAGLLASVAGVMLFLGTAFAIASSRADAWRRGGLAGEGAVAGMFTHADERSSAVVALSQGAYLVDAVPHWALAAPFIAAGIVFALLVWCAYRHFDHFELVFLAFLLSGGLCAVLGAVAALPGARTPPRAVAALSAPPCAVPEVVEAAWGPPTPGAPAPRVAFVREGPVQVLGALGPATPWRYAARVVVPALAEREVVVHLYPLFALARLRPTAFGETQALVAVYLACRAPDGRYVGARVRPSVALASGVPALVRASLGAGVRPLARSAPVDRLYVGLTVPLPAVSASAVRRAVLVPSPAAPAAFLSL